MTWPQISFVAEDHKGRIVGYVLAKMCFFWQYDYELSSEIYVQRWSFRRREGCRNTWTCQLHIGSTVIQASRIGKEAHAFIAYGSKCLLDFWFPLLKVVPILFIQRKQWHPFTKHLTCLCMFENRIKRRSLCTVILSVLRLQRSKRNIVGQISFSTCI